jgi:hypothetical protein
MKKKVVDKLTGVIIYPIKGMSESEAYWRNNVVMNKFYDFDKRGIRAFVRYSDASGKWGIEVYRKKPESDWKMIRVGSTQTYFSRQEAEIGALELAESVAKEFGY